MNKKRIVIVGASSAMAEHCARLWVQAGAIDLILLGRNLARIEPIAADLRVRSPQSSVCAMTAEFLDAQAIQHMAQSIAAQGKVDIVLIAHGVLTDQASCQQDLQACSDSLQINGLSPVLYAEAFAQILQQQNQGTLALIGSVAGDRGRKSNYVYGAAKGLVSRYAQGLQHRFAGSPVKVVLIKPGPTDTPMTAHLKQQGAKLAPVNEVAKMIVAAIDRGQSVAYVPGKWALIMQVIRHLPRWVFNHLNI